MCSDNSDLKYSMFYMGNSDLSYLYNIRKCFSRRNYERTSVKPTTRLKH